MKGWQKKPYPANPPPADPFKNCCGGPGEYHYYLAAVVIRALWHSGFRIGGGRRRYPLQ